MNSQPVGSRVARLAPSPYEIWPAVEERQLTYSLSIHPSTHVFVHEHLLQSLLMGSLYSN